MRHITKDKGDLAVAKTIADLAAHNIRCCLPLSEHLPFDLIAVMPDMRTLRRVQVKYRAVKLGSIHLPFRSNYYDSKRIYSKHVNFDELDTYATYCPDNGKIYYLRVDEIHEDAVQICLRVEPTKNSQIKGVRFAQDYINAHRIAEFSDVSPSLRRSVSELDELAINYVIADLMANGVQPFIVPSQYVPFDLVGVLPDMKTMQRIRVGYQQHNLSHEVDVYAVYEPTTKMVCYMDTDGAAIPSLQ